MKRKILKPVCCIILPMFMLVACSKDFDDEKTYLGNWIEKAPAPERTELRFLTPSILAIKKGEGVVEEYRYHIEEDSIFLMVTENFPEGPESPFFFKLIDDNTLQIEDLYPRIPEMEPGFIVFDRI